MKIKPVTVATAPPLKNLPILKSLKIQIKSKFTGLDRY